jgi:hypothetical protein
MNDLMATFVMVRLSIEIRAVKFSPAQAPARWSVSRRKEQVCSFERDIVST